MVDSTRLRGVGGECAAGAAEALVEADAGGEREQAEGDSRAEVVQGSGAVTFEREDVLAGAEDRFDALSDRREVWPAFVLVAAGGRAGRGWRRARRRRRRTRARRSPCRR